MKIALTVKGAGLGAWLDENFAHCGHIMVVGDDNRFTSWPNPYRDGSTTQQKLLAEKVIAESVDVLITGDISQEDQDKIKAAGIDVVVRDQGTVFKLVDEIRNRN